MTSAVVVRAPEARRHARERRFLMCPPTYFEVVYAINPWMDPSRPVDSGLAMGQWESLVAAYRAHGHRVDLLEALPGLPDMVFAANGATVVDGHVLLARFAEPQRSAEAIGHAGWHREHAAEYGGTAIAVPVAVNEAEGDFAVLAERILAGYGFRSSLAAHRELAALTGREVISLELVDPRFYHLDVALTVLDDVTDQIAYYPAAFSPASQEVLTRLFPGAIRASSADAFAFGLNCVSDGATVFVPAGARALMQQLDAAGYDVAPIELSELIKGGGSVKCCTQEIRQAPSHPTRS
ncbi:MAG TPA: arginine deiminase-related protein [Marmoricola sp.]|nr:arginine deiminase-related protein [Marmoricola sp.]